METIEEIEDRIGRKLRRTEKLVLFLINLEEEVFGEDEEDKEKPYEGGEIIYDQY